MPAPEEALTAGNITFTGYEGAESTPTRPCPPGDGPFPGVLVIHHLPGWDSGTKEITRRFAAEGYNALCPNLYARQGLDVDPDDAAAATREAGGIPDDQFVGDADAAVKAPARPAHIQRQGRRHRLLLGRTALLPDRGERARRCGGRLLRGLRDRHRSRRLPAQGDAAGRPHARPHVPAPRPLRQRRPVPQPRAGRRAGGRRSRTPARPTSSTATTAPATPSSRWSVRPTGPRPRSTAGSASSSGTAATWRGADHVLLPHRRHRDRRQRQGSAGMDAGHRRPASTSTIRSTRRSTTRSTSTSPTRHAGPGARVAVELSAESAAALVESINEALGRCRGRRHVTAPTGPAAGVHLPWAEVPERGADVGGRRRWRRAPTRPATLPAGSRRGRPRVLDCPGGAIFVKAVGAALNPESPELPPARGGGVGRVAAGAGVPAPARRLRRRRLGGAGLRGDRRGGRRRIRGTPRRARGRGARPLDALHDALTPSPVPARSPPADRLQSHVRRLGRAGRPRARPRGLDCVEPPAPGPRLAELESGWPGAVRGLDAAPRRRARRQPAGHRRRRRVRGLAARVPSAKPVFDLVGLGAVGRAGGRPGAGGAPGPARAGSRSTRTSSPCWWLPSRASSSTHSLRAAHRPGLPTLRAVPGRPGRGGAGLAAAPDRVVTAASPAAHVGSAACASDCRSPTSPPTRLPAPSSTGWSAMATAAEETGLRLGLGDGPLLPTPAHGRPEPADARRVHAARRAGGADVAGPARDAW